MKTSTRNKNSSITAEDITERLIDMVSHYNSRDAILLNNNLYPTNWSLNGNEYLKYCLEKTGSVYIIFREHPFFNTDYTFKDNYSIIDFDEDLVRKSFKTEIYYDKILIYADLELIRRFDYHKAITKNTIVDTLTNQLDAI